MKNTIRAMRTLISPVVTVILSFSCRFYTRVTRTKTLLERVVILYIYMYIYNQRTDEENTIFLVLRVSCYQSSAK